MSTTMSKSSDEPFRRVEVITSGQHRRRWSVAEKIRLAEETMQPGMSISYVARQAGISPSHLFAWKRRILEGGHAPVQADEDVVGASQVRDLKKRVRDLGRMLGRKTMEAEIPREALDLARPPRPCSCGAIPGTILNERYYKNAGRLQVRGPYRKADDVALAELRQIIDERPTYGYRRMTAFAQPAAAQGG